MVASVPPGPHADSQTLTTSQKRQLVAPLVLRGTSCRGFDSRTQYRGVYPKRAGWRAKVKFWATEGQGGQVNLRTHKDALDAAVELARWWESRLGPHWAEIVWRRAGQGGCRRGEGGRVWRDVRVPWRIHRDKKADKRRGAERHYCVCWVRGVTTRVPGYWPTRRDAAHGLFAWLEAKFGGGAVLWFPGEGPRG